MCPGLSADTAYNCDPRIKKFKDDEKARKESEKKAKADAKRKEQEDKDRVSHGKSTSGFTPSHLLKSSVCSRSGTFKICDVNMCGSAGSPGRTGGCPASQGEGGRGGQAGRLADQEREGHPEEGHKEREAETQDCLQGADSLVLHSSLKRMLRVFVQAFL